MRLIEAAINGSRTRGEHASLPITGQELASEAAATVRAGAGAIHFHIRSQSGEETPRAGDLSLALIQIRPAAPNVRVGVSTGAWILDHPAARLAAVHTWKLLPDFPSLNFHELAELLMHEVFRWKPEFRTLQARNCWLIPAWLQVVSESSLSHGIRISKTRAALQERLSAC
jgi:uncharacterized protein (DUF849 family)